VTLGLNIWSRIVKSCSHVSLTVVSSKHSFTQRNCTESSYMVTHDTLPQINTQMFPMRGSKDNNHLKADLLMYIHIFA